MEPNEEGKKAEVVQGDSKPRMYTEDEVQARLRGQGNELKKLKEKISQFETAAEERSRKKLEEEGKFKELLRTTEGNYKTLEEKYNSLVEKENNRVKAVAKSNKARLESLPDEYKELVPEGLEPDAVRDHIGKLEALTVKSTKVVAVNGGPPKNGAGNDGGSDAAAKGKAWIFGGEK